MDIILSFLAKPLDKHDTTLVHNTYPPMLGLVGALSPSNTIQPDIHPNIRLAGYSRAEYSARQIIIIIIIIIIIVQNVC